MRVVVVVIAVVMAGLVATQKELPDVIVGDPNDSANDVLGEPISEAELEASLSLEVEDVEGDPISSSGYYEGDIMVENEDRLYQLLESNGQNSAIRDPSLLWTDGQIPYVISSTFSSSERRVIARAMAEFHRETCIRFVPRSNHAYYIHILQGQGCSSNVGRARPGQSVSLGNGCVHLGIVIHELMHAAGFWHEQSRADRDSYVTINWSNIREKLKYNFAKKSLHVSQDLGLPYDFGSLMHYGSYAFAKNRNNPTITPKTSGVTIGQRRGFSKLDIEGLNKLYRCTSRPTTITTTTTTPITTTTTTTPITTTTTTTPVTTTTTTTTPVTTTTTRPSSCRDNHHFCQLFSRRGYCATHPSFMNSNCRKSCRICGGDGGSSNCRDLARHCSDWAARGDCQRIASYMRIACKKSCNLCEANRNEGNKKCTDDSKIYSD